MSKAKLNLPQSPANNKLDIDLLSCDLANAGVDAFEVGGDIQDQVQLVRAVDECGPFDQATLAANPQWNSFQRPATPSEQVAYGLPDGAIAIVGWTPDGCLLREYAVEE